MNKKILILAITASFIISSIPLAEASISWNGFLRDIGFGGSQIYEVTGQGFLLEGEIRGESFEIRCLAGDIMYLDYFEFVHTPSLQPEEFINGGRGIISEPTSESVVSQIPIGAFFVASLTDEFGNSIPSSRDYTIDGKIFCLSPSPLVSSTVGGEWQATDTIALFIGYSVLNAYWLAPTLAGIGAGVYLTKSKWKKSE